MAVEENGKLTVTLRRYWDDNVYKTVCIYVCFFCLGLAASVLGPTIIQLEELFTTDTQTMAWTFTCFFIGYALGASLCGLIYDRVNPELLFMLSVMFFSVGLAIAPFVGGMYGFMMSMWVEGLFFGLIDSAGQPYILNIWDGHKKKDPLLQGLHTIWSAGATIGPLVVRQFLVDIGSKGPIHACWMAPPTSNQTHSTLSSALDINGNDSVTLPNMASAKYQLFEPKHMLENRTSPEIIVGDQLGRVRWAYITTGGVVMVSAVLFLIAFILNRPYIARIKLPYNAKMEPGGRNTYITRKWHSHLVLFFMFIFYFTYAAVEMTPGNFLSAFVQKELCWENKQGALLISIFFACQGISRICGVFVSIFLSPRTMLIGNLGMQVLAFILMLFVGKHSLIMWFSTAFAGFGMGTTFGTGFLWMAAYMPITGRVSSVFFVASSFGFILNPIIVGYMFDNYSPMWVIYVSLTASVAMVMVFVGVDLLTKYISYLARRKPAEPDREVMSL